MNTSLSIADRERVLRMARAANLERSASTASAIERIDRGNTVPLSFAQQRLWFLEQMGGLGSTFHVRLHRRLRGTLDRAALVRVLDRIVARHEALRTTFVHVDGVPEQRITPAEASRFHLFEYDLRGRAEAQSELERLIAEETRTPFDLAQGPLIRGRLVRLAEDEHVLLVTMHHLVSDGWSVGVFARELATLYAAFLRGEPDPLPPLSVQYADYAGWQRRWLSGEVLHAQAEFWRQALSGAPGSLTLPLDHPRPARMNHAGEQIHLAMDEALTAGLKALAQRHGATLFMVILAGWAVVLSRLAGQSEVVIGTPTAGRNRREIEGLIGFFVNTLAVRVDLSAALTVAELLAGVKERVLDAQHHQDIPFEQVVELVDPVRSLAHHPIFQVLFTWQNAQPGGGGLVLPGLQVGSVATRLDVRAECDLTLELSEVGGRIVGRIWYFTSLFEQETAERYVRYLPLVLEAMIADETQRVDRLTLLPADERCREIDTWNRTRAEYPRESCLHELCEQQVARAPDAPAVIFEDACLTYAELNQRANQLAHHLRSLSVGPETRVALCLERSPDMVVALLAVLKAGGAYVPLDPAYPAERLEYMLADSAPAVVLTQGSVRERLTALFGGLAEHVPVLEVDASDPTWASAPTTNPSHAGLSPAHPAYVIYTSGSTGRPKGVVVPHQGLCNVAAAQQREFQVGPDDRLLQFFSLSFDAAAFEMVMAFTSGAALCVASRDALLPGPQLLTLLRQHAITIVSLPPSALAALPVEDLPALRTIATAGEVLPTELVARWGGRHRLLNLYGPTEATIWSTCAECTNSDAPPDIGAPISNTSAYVLDAEGEPVPVGVAGELHVGGVGVARGYLKRPGLTADRFVPDPFSAQPGARLYRTGDRVARRADGRLDFLGRVDQQVKVRGFRIELGEIEARLAEHPAVRAAVVIARDATPGDTRLVAYVVSDATPGADELRAHVSEMLPEHMVPTAYVRLEALPLTPNGKLDRKALPAPEGDAYPTPEYEAPLGETEEVLARIWSELLGVERVGRWDHFFELGGHSLMAITLSERMTKQGLHADVRTVFSAPTLASLAAAVSGEHAAVEVPPNRIPEASAAITPEMLPLVALTQAQIDAVVAAVPGGAANVQDIYPLAPLQEGFLFHHLLVSEGDPYLKGAFFYFASRERLDAYVQALGAVIARHDVLRTSIAWDDLPEPVQVVWRHAPLAVEEVEVGPDDGDVATDLFRRFDPRRHQLDLRRAPVMRGYVAPDVAHGRWVLLLLHHHLVCDHMALEVLQSEIAAHLSGRVESLPEPLPYRNYVAQTRLGISQAEHRAFFTDLLGDVDETTAPFGLRDVRRDGTGMDVAWLMVEEPLARRLRERARGLGVSAASLFHVALAQVVARTSGRDDVVFGTVLFGRMQAAGDAARMMGLFINTLPVRIRVGDVGVEASVKATHAVLTGLLHHEHAPLALAQRCSGVPAPAPLFTCVMNYRHSNQRPRAIPTVAGVSTDQSRTILAGERSNYPFDIAVDDLGAIGFRLEAQVAPGVKARRVCALLHSALESLVDALTDTPDRPLRQLPVLPEAERRLVVEEWNRTEADFPRDSSLPRLFEAQVARTPDAVAVQSHDDALTYCELNLRANRLGHYLIELGVGPDTRVAVCTERSLDAIAALLAVLKAGGAFVPLDPALPVERMRSMLRDSAPTVVLVQADVQALRALVAEVAGHAPVLRLDGAAAWAHQPAINPQCPTLRPEHLAYVVYTSGSTGTPKGVMVEHRSVCNHTLAVERALSLTPDDRVLQFAPVAFDIAVEEIFGALTSGATLILRDDSWLAGAGTFLEHCERNRVTVMDLPTRFWKLLLDERVAMPSCMRLLVIGGEAVELDVLNVWFGRAGHRPRLFIASGPTETTIDTTMQEALDAESASRALGRPMANTRAYIMDAAMEPVPVGVTGELYIGGVQVTRGYLGRPALTADLYVPDPFGDAGTRLYRTGDLGRWRGDGTIQFAGRADFQVKVRGFRVELGEIEARLRDHPDVHEAVVLAREDAAGDKRLVAYVVGGDGARPDVLRAHLAGVLPEFMVPAAYVRLQELPLTSTGKLDRKALPAPDGGSDDADVYEAPIGETEHALAEIWSEVLSIDRVSRHDDFFELGGHSLLAVQVISRVQQRLMVDVDLGELFTRPTLKDFAQKLETAPRAELPPIEPESRLGRLPLSFAQQRLWFLEQLQDLGSTYHVPWRHRLRGALDRSALKRALDRIVARHEALRTTFAQVEGVPQQTIASPDASSFLLLEHDLTGQPDALTELKRVTAEELGAPFDLQRGPLVRGRLVKMAADDHVLLVTMHHIVSDAWSTTVITREMNALYDAFRRGEPDPLPALAVHYADYAAWQRRWVDGDLLERQAQYWVETLAGAPELLQVPTDRPRPAAMDHRGAQLPVQLDAELTEALKALGRRHGTTLFMTLLTGWAIVLGRLSRQDDLVIGTPTANRGRPEIEPLIGFFVNTLALRVDLSGSPTVGELLGRVKARAIHAQRHQDIPFEKIVELVDPARSMSHTPLFQAMFAWQSDMQGDDLSFAGVRQGAMGSGSSHAPAKFDLSLALRETGARIAGSVVYATALFDRDTVTRHVGYLQRVLEQMVADDGQPVERLAILPESERARLVREGNGPQAEIPRASCVHDLFEAQVRRTPTADACVFEGDRLTYSELNLRANRLAHHLIALGVGPDARVGMCVERSLELVVGMLAVLKAGGGYVPLDPSYPPDRVAYMVTNSAPRVLLTQKRLRHLVEGTGVPVLELDVASPEWADRPSTNPARRGLTPEHLAYMTYTSGSTGRPKGVMNPHRASVNRFAWLQERHGLRAGEGVLQNSSFSFDASVFEIVWPLTVGARVVLPRPDGHKNPEELVRLILGEDVTTAYFVCSMLQLFVDYEAIERCTTLTRVLCGGEALSAALAQRVSARLPLVRLHNLYGPTESAVSVSGAVPLTDAGATVAIGRPVPNVTVYLLDDFGEPVPVGVAGELCVAGAQLARGYHDRPALTAERFVADPYGTEPGARMYRTGDLARWQPDGTIEFLGRLDSQVKVRGYRIEPGEIESRLVEHASVREAAVLVREDAPGDVRLVVYWAGDAVEPESLRAHLSATLPSYMVPSAYMRLERLPLTPSGKLDRAALPAPVGLSTRSYEPPAGESEQALARIWAEVLRAERVGRYDDFFALGGHSLLAVQVIARVREALKREATLGALFTWPVLKDLAQQLGTVARATLPAIEVAQRTERIPLSFAQRRLWFLEQLGGLGSTYHLRRRLTFRGALDRTALARALDAMVARHESLRTTFAQANGVPEQRIAPADVGLRLIEHDVSHRADAGAELTRVTNEEVRAPFDLAVGPLVRGRLIRMAADEHVLLLTMHHVISDGWSMGIFTRELRVLYGAFRDGTPNPLPALPVQYADYAAWQQQWVAGEVIEQQADYWTRTLAGAPELLELPTDRPRPSRMHHAGDAFGVELDEALTAGLKTLARRHGATLFMTVLAGWAAVLSRLSGQDDVVIGTPSAGRGRREIEGLIGFFVNTLALRFDLSGDPTVAGLLNEVKGRTLAAQEHQDIPFEQVVEVVAPARSLSHSPIFQAMFVWVETSWTGGGRAPSRLEQDGESGGVATESPDGQAQIELTLALSERAGRIVGTVEYMTALFERETVARYVGHLRQVLAAMVADDQQRVARLRWLPEDDRRQLIETWNRTATAYPPASCVHDLFEAQVAQTPDAVAVTYADRALTYAELNARANRLAHHLIARGVGPEARVGLYLERSLEMVIGLLAVLKAGGAYVPLDPADPVERLETMLADCAPVVVLTEVGLAARLRGGARPILALDAEPAPWAAQSALNPARAGLTPDQLAYIIYTSGSTGLPKGVMNAHRGVVNRLRWMQDAYGLGAGDAVLQKTPYAFDVSVWEFFWTLGVGARLVVAPPQVHKDPAYLAATIRTEGITTIHFVPSMLQRFLDAAETAGGAGLRRVVCSGEALSAALMARVHARLPGAELINLYGPTEAAVDVTAWRCEPGAATVSLGRPIANTQIYVLDRELEPVPVGVSGELYIGGVQVARGYRNRPALTAERFVADPFGGAGARLYATGDRGRWRPNGTLEYLGRTDFQVKVRGFRIELGEIETRLAAHPAVREAVVLAREDTPGERRLVAYVVGDDTVGADELRAHLRETLPEHMVPAAYVRLGPLPLTPNGKLDRKALPAPDDHAYARRGYEPPLGETEEVLARIWTEVLGIERVGRTDNFFELGGHSLLAVQMLARVREELAVDVPTGGVFGRPRLADFARELTSPSQVGLPAIEPAGREGRIPLSFPQHRLWSLERHAGVRGAARPAMRVRLKGGLDEVALIAALEGIVARHEVLRTTVVEVGGVPEQRIAPATSRLTLRGDDLRGLTNAQVELARLMIEEVRAPFDLAQGPLIRGRLIRLDEDDHVLVITVHPIVADGWSTEIFARELTALYGAVRRGEPDPLPPLPLQYADYALWQRRCVAGDALKAQADYWKNTLGGAPEVLELPTDHPRPARQDYAGARVALELDTTQTRELRALARRHRVTMFTALLAGWGIVLHRLSGQDDVVIGSPIANRRRREIQGIIGAFENTLALRLNLSGTPTVADLLAQVKARIVEAHHHQDIPFEEVAASAQPARSLSHTPVFQAMFAWRNAPQPAIALPGLAIAPVTRSEPPVLPEPVSQATARFDLTLSLTERDERIVGSVTYATALFERATVERHAGYLRLVLEAMAANDQLAVGALPLFTEDTRETARGGSDDGRPIAIRAAGSQTPLFLVHEGTGSVAYAQALEPFIADDIPVYALPPPSSAQRPSRTIEGMATGLVRMIHEIRPSGPYRVAGWSFGGVLAYEIATQLLGEDEVVEFVGLFDAESPGRRPAGSDGADGRDVFADAVRGYVPQPIPAPVHLFVGQQNADVDLSRGWEALLPGSALQVTPVLGTRLSMMQPPHVAAVGRALSAAMACPRKVEKTLPAAGDLSVLKLQNGKRGVAPMFCIPGAGTSVTSFIDLIGVLDPSWPVYGFQPRGMDGTTVPHSTVSAATRCYLHAIEDTCPDGPIHLLGHSFGGWVAFEMALRLHAAGRPVGSLTILDTEVPETDARSYELDTAQAFVKLVEGLELSAERSFGITRDDIDATDERGRLKLLDRKMVQYGLLNARSTDENVLYGSSRVFARCLRTIYRPSGRYPDRLRLVLVNDPREDEAANRKAFAIVVRGWKQWAPKLVVSTATGNHMTMLKPPHVATLAGYLAHDRRQMTNADVVEM